jgi:23S rRNA pseudouridine1911/1915/1917 synthase
MKLPVPPESEGARVDAFLAGPLGSRSRAQRLIEAGGVSIGGTVVAKRRTLNAGDVVEVREDAEPVAPQEAARHLDIPVLLEDEHLLVVDKPAGLVVHPGKGNRTGTLAQALAGRAAGGEEDWRAGIVHRLDRDTSGLMVVAKSDAAHRELKALIQARGVRREYLALVEGRPPARSGTIDAPIGRDRRVRTRISTDTDEPRDARTHFTLERALPETTLLRVVLETGRTHQIRVHMQAIGHPVCGDPEYGTAGLLGLERQFLHAARLAFEHPLTAEAVDLQSPLPDDLAVALAAAEAPAAGR